MVVYLCGDIMTDDFPTKPSWIEQQAANLTKWYNRWFTGRPIFVIEISGIKIKHGWSQITKYETVNYNEVEYDSTPSYNWYGSETIFVKKGVRVPIKFDAYLSCFEDVNGDERKRLALDGVLANTKMNNRNAAEFVRANKNADIMLYMTAGILIFSIAILAGQLDYIHLPAATESHNFYQFMQNWTYWHR